MLLPIKCVCILSFKAIETGFSDVSMYICSHNNVFYYSIMVSFKECVLFLNIHVYISALIFILASMTVHIILLYGPPLPGIQ